MTLPKVGGSSPGSTSTGDVHRHGQRRRHDVLALGEHGTLEAADVVDRRAGDLRDVLGRQAGADERLHLAGRRLGAGVRLGLRLADAGLQHLVDLDPEACAIVGCGEQRAVLDSDYLEFLHRDKPFRAFVSAQGCHGALGADGNRPGAAEVEEVAVRTGRTSGLLTPPI